MKKNGREWRMCHSKQRFVTDYEARKYSKKKEDELEVYQCPVCRGYHLTSCLKYKGKYEQQYSGETEGRISRTDSDPESGRNFEKERKRSRRADKSTVHGDDRAASVRSVSCSERYAVPSVRERVHESTRRKLVVVGESPAKGYENEKPILNGCRTGSKWREWCGTLDIDPEDCEYYNVFNADGSKHESFEALRCEDRIVIPLGKIALKHTLLKNPKYVIELPHPSGRNRKLNNKGAVSALLQDAAEKLQKLLQKEGLNGVENNNHALVL